MDRYDAVATQCDLLVTMDGPPTWLIGGVPAPIADGAVATWATPRCRDGRIVWCGPAAAEPDTGLITAPELEPG